MRIVPINNNNFNYKGQTPIIKHAGKFKTGIAAAVIATVGINCYNDREEWKKLFLEIKEDRIERLENKRYEPLVKDFDSHEAAINYAFDRILPWINDDSPREYCVEIDNNTHSILSEYRGTENTVTPYRTLSMRAKIKFDKDFSYTSIHGHPGQSNGGTSTFSDVDLKTFLKNDACTEDYVVNRDRKYCRLKKEKNYRKPTEEELNRILEDYNRVCNMAAAWQKTIIDKNGNIVFEIVDYPAMHDALKRYLEPFGISYVTTYGTYGAFEDIYKDGFYEAFKGGKLVSTTIAK